MSDITDEELAEMEVRRRVAERSSTNNLTLITSDVPRLIAALRASREEVERLRAWLDRERLAWEKTLDDPKRRETLRGL